MKLGTELGLSPCDITLDGDPTTQKGAQLPQFLAYVYCGQTGGWISMPLGMEVGLSPGHIVLDGDQLPPKGAQPPNFRPMFVVLKRLDESNSLCFL